MNYRHQQKIKSVKTCQQQEFITIFLQSTSYELPVSVVNQCHGVPSLTLFLQAYLGFSLFALTACQQLLNTFISTKTITMTQIKPIIITTPQMKLPLFVTTGSGQQPQHLIKTQPKSVQISQKSNMGLKNCIRSKKRN